jgi:glutaconate CoA-transferase subunit B
MPFPETNISIEEYLSFLISKEVCDGELTGVGTLSPVPLMGALLEKKTHAQSGKLFIFGDEKAAIVDGSKELFDLAQRGRLGLFFLSGAQIDKRGNVNLTCIGEYDAPKVRLPGGAGSGMLSYMARRTVLFAMNHNRKIFVEKLDFTTARGDDDYPWRIGSVTNVITPLCVFSYKPGREQIVLESLHPGVSEAKKRRIRPSPMKKRSTSSGTR